MKRLGWILTGGVAVLAVLVAVALWGLGASRPDDPASLPGPGLEAPVTIRYDAARRPFVAAASLGDALWAEGWLHARERLWQMELLRRAGRGRLAEALGPGVLASDRELWRAGVPQLGQVLETNASASLRDHVARYVGGINAAMARLTVAPPEFLLVGLDPQPWEPADVFAVAAVVAFQSANNYGNELLRLALAAELDAARFAWFLPQDPAREDFPYVLPPVAPASAPVSLPAAAARAALSAFPLKSSRIDAELDHCLVVTRFGQLFKCLNRFNCFSLIH